MTDISTTTPLPAAAPDAADLAPPPPSRATFDVLPLSREVREVLAEIGYTHPTPVQIAVWEPATRGRDAVVQARTGTGKTAAFGLPIVDHLVRRSQREVQALALCPTRELALQVAAELERLGKKRNVKVTAIYGGAPMQRQIDALAEGAQVVVGTPGRVLDHLRRGTLDPKHIRMLVLDEADEMLSMGFEREVTAILDSLPKERQTLLFSATLPPDIDRMAKKLRQPEYLTLSGDHVGALEIEHFVYMVASDKIAALARIIEVENPESAVVFCNTKDETERVAQTLARQGYDADWLNGDLPQSDREKVMSATREGRLRFLVATDVAARGIDISHLTHVINYDFPQDAESYVHRTGRTGRAGRTGTAISLITPHDVGGLYLLRLTYKIRPIEKQIPTEGELRTRAEADLVAMLAEAFTSKSAHPDDLALARRLLTHEQAEAILAGLLRDHLGARPSAQQQAAAARRATKPAPAPVMPASVTMGPRAAPNPAPPAAAPIEAPNANVEEAKPPAARAPAMPLPARAPREQREPREEKREPREPREERREPREERRGRDRDDRRSHAPGPRPERQERRPRREEHVPVSAAEGTREGHFDPARPPQRHADFISWQPPEEEGDDEPILGAGGPEAAPRPEHEGRGRRHREDREGRGERGRDRDRRGPARETAPPAAPVERSEAPAAAPEATGEGEPAAAIDGDFVEIYVNVGRRDGARAADFQRVLTERAGIDRALVRRIRVRDRNAFVSVRREDLAKALASLQGASIAGKTAMAEQARERAGENEAAPAVSGEPATLTAGTSADAPPPVASSAPTPPAGIPVTPADEAITAPLAIEPPEPAIATASPEPGDQDDAVPTGRSAS